MNLLQMAKDLTIAQISSGSLAEGEVLPSLAQTFTVLQSLDHAEKTQGVEPIQKTQTPSDWKESIRKDVIICLECNQQFRMLMARHLQTHGLTGKSYKEKHGIPRSIPLSSRRTTTRRRAVAMTVRPWEKAPATIKARQKATA